MLTPDELCVVNLHTMWIHSFTTAAEAPAAIEAAKRKYPKAAPTGHTKGEQHGKRKIVYRSH